MERLASGNAVYETPDAVISENKITVELETGATFEDEISIRGKNGMAVEVALQRTGFAGILFSVFHMVPTFLAAFHRRKRLPCLPLGMNLKPGKEARCGIQFR